MEICAAESCGDRSVARACSELGSGNNAESIEEMDRGSGNRFGWVAIAASSHQPATGFNTNPISGARAAVAVWVAWSHAPPSAIQMCENDAAATVSRFVWYASLTFAPPHQFRLTCCDLGRMFDKHPLPEFNTDTLYCSFGA